MDNTKFVFNQIRFINQDRKFFTSLYRNYFPEINKLITDDSGNTEDAKDIFQEALLIIYEKMKKDKLHLTCSFGTYLFAVCKNLWFKELRRRKSVFIDDYEMYTDCIISDDDMEELYSDYREKFKQRLLYKHFKNLSKICQKIIKYHSEGIKNAEIAQILNLKSEEIVRKKKYNCIMILMNHIRKDPNFIYIDL